MHFLLALHALRQETLGFRLTPKFKIFWQRTKELTGIGRPGLGNKPEN